jgi:hypothetical protein
VGQKRLSQRDGPSLGVMATLDDIPRDGQMKRAALSCRSAIRRLQGPRGTAQTASYTTPGKPRGTAVVDPGPLPS